MILTIWIRHVVNAALGYLSHMVTSSIKYQQFWKWTMSLGFSFWFVSMEKYFFFFPLLIVGGYFLGNNKPNWIQCIKKFFRQRNIECSFDVYRFHLYLELTFSFFETSIIDKLKKALLVLKVCVNIIIFCFFTKHLLKVGICSIQRGF